MATILDDQDSVCLRCRLPVCVEDVARTKGVKPENLECAWTIAKQKNNNKNKAVLMQNSCGFPDKSE